MYYGNDSHDFWEQVRQLKDFKGLMDYVLHQNNNEDSYYIEDDEDGEPIYNMDWLGNDLDTALEFLEENCSFDDPEEEVAIARCINLEDITYFDVDNIGECWTSPKHFYDFASGNLPSKNLYCITALTSAKNIDWVESASLYVSNCDEYELRLIGTDEYDIWNIKLWKVKGGKMVELQDNDIKSMVDKDEPLNKIFESICNKTKLKEKIMINGEEYEDSYGEDLNTAGLKKDSPYQFTTIDGVKKRLYKVSGKLNKDTGKRAPDKYYAKLRKHEPVTEIDDANSWAASKEGEDFAVLDGEKIKITAYKQFKILYDSTNDKTKEDTKYALAPNGEPYLYPLFIKSHSGKFPKGIEVGKWYKCGVGELKIQVNPETGEPIQGAALQVDSALGNLSYRPGWHLASLPLTAHIGKNTNGKKRKDGGSGPADYEFTCSQYVWCKVEYSAHFDFTEKAKERPGAKTDAKKACFTNKHDFDDGFYHYKTNTNASDDEDWLIADSIKIIRVLDDDEVKEIVGDKAQKRWIADKSDDCKFMVDFSLFQKRLEDTKETSIKDYNFNKIFNDAGQGE